MGAQCERTFLAGILILLLTTTLIAQPPDTMWTKTYGGTGFEEAHSIIETSGGGYIVAGYTNSFGEGELDVYLIKTNANGDSVWAKTYGGPQDDQGLGVVETTDGGYIAVGKTFSFGAGGMDMYAVKTSADGDSIWAKTYGDESMEQAFAVCEASDGGYIICGSSAGDACLLKIDEAGDTVWVRTYGKESEDWGLGVAQTTDGGYIVAGWADMPGNNIDVYLIKTDLNWDPLWTRTYGGADIDMSSDVQETSDGYIICGTTESFAESGWDIWTLKLDTNGDTLWTRTYGGLGDQMGLSAEVAPDGNYIFAGTNSGAWLIKTDPLGNTIWEKNCGGDLAYSVRLTSDNGYIVGGMISTAGGDVYLVKLEPEVGVKEQPVGASCFEVVTCVGPQVVLHYSNSPNGICATLFDAAGRKVDKIQYPPTSGTITWGKEQSPGVYFMKLETADYVQMERLVILR